MDNIGVLREVAKGFALGWLERNRTYTNREILSASAMSGKLPNSENKIYVYIAIQGSGDNAGYKRFSFHVTFSDDKDPQVEFISEENL